MTLKRRFIFFFWHWCVSNAWRLRAEHFWGLSRAGRWRVVGFSQRIFFSLVRENSYAVVHFFTFWVKIGVQKMDIDGRYSEYSGVCPVIQQSTRQSAWGAEPLRNRSKKKRDIVPLTFPKIKPADGAGMYLLSKFYQREPKYDIN